MKQLTAVGMTAIILIWSAASVQGSGLESNGIGARGRSMGFAMVAMAEDWSVVHYNPAGAALIEGRVIGGEYEFFTGGMHCTESLRNLPVGFGDPWRGDFTDPIGDEPAAFGTKDITSDIHFGAFGYVDASGPLAWGIGLYGSGSGTAWSDTVVTAGLGDTVDAEVAYTNGSANIPVVLAWRVRPELALGVTFGLHWGMLTVENTKERTGAVPYIMDTTQDTQGTALGIDLGALWQARDDLALGAVIKLPYTFRKTGTTETEQSLLPLTADSDTTVDMKYPLRIALGCAWDITERDLFAAGITWLNWNRFRMITDYKDEIPFILEDTNANPGHWRNTYRLHAGYERALNEKWDLRCGLTYDQAPEPEEYRTLTGGQVIDAWLLTVGAGVDLGDLKIDFGYIYTYGAPVDGFIPGAEYSMILHEFFVGIIKTF